jgi:hypothetical protein
MLLTHKDLNMIGAMWVSVMGVAGLLKWKVDKTVIPQ